MTTTTKTERPRYEVGNSQALDPRYLVAEVARGAAHTFAPEEFEQGAGRLEAMCVVGLDRRGLLTLDGEPIPLHQVVLRSEIEQGHIQFVAGPTASGDAFDAFLFATFDGTGWVEAPTEMTIRIVEPETPVVPAGSAADSMADSPADSSADAASLAAFEVGEVGNRDSAVEAGAEMVEVVVEEEGSVSPSAPAAGSVEEGPADDGTADDGTADDGTADDGTAVDGLPGDDSRNESTIEPKVEPTVEPKVDATSPLEAGKPSAPEGRESFAKRATPESAGSDSGAQSPPQVSLTGSSQGKKKMAMPAALRGFSKAEDEEDGWTPRASKLQTSRPGPSREPDVVEPRTEEPPKAAPAAESSPAAVWPDAVWPDGGADKSKSASKSGGAEPQAVWPSQGEALTKPSTADAPRDSGSDSSDAARATEESNANASASAAEVVAEPTAETEQAAERAAAPAPEPVATWPTQEPESDRESAEATAAATETDEPRSNDPDLVGDVKAEAAPLKAESMTPSAAEPEPRIAEVADPSADLSNDGSVGTEGLAEPAAKPETLDTTPAPLAENTAEKDAENNAEDDAEPNERVATLTESPEFESAPDSASPPHEALAQTQDSAPVSALAPAPAATQSEMATTPEAARDPLDDDSSAPIPPAGISEPAQEKPAQRKPAEGKPANAAKPEDGSTLSALEKAPAQLVELGFDLAAEPPAAGDNLVTTNEGSFYCFKPSDFNFVGPENRFQRIRIEGLETCGELTFDHRPVETGQEIDVEDIFLDMLRFHPSDPGKEGFEFCVFDGVEWSTTPNSMLIQVKPYYLPPTASDQSIEVQLGERFGLKLEHFGYKSLCEGDALQKVRVTDYELSGTVTLDGIEIDADQTLLREELDGSRVEYLPRRLGQADQLRFLVHDGTAFSNDSYVLRFEVMEPEPVVPAEPAPAAVAPETKPEPAPATPEAARVEVEQKVEVEKVEIEREDTDDATEESTPELWAPKPEEDPVPEVAAPREPMPGRLPGAVSPAEFKRSKGADPLAGTRLPGLVSADGSGRFAKAKSKAEPPRDPQRNPEPAPPQVDQPESTDKLQRADLTPQSTVTHRNPLPPVDGEQTAGTATPKAAPSKPTSTEDASKAAEPKEPAGPPRPRPGKMHKSSPSDSKTSGRWRASSPANKKGAKQTEASKAPAIKTPASKPTRTSPSTQGAGGAAPGVKSPVGLGAQRKRPVAPSVGPTKKTSSGVTGPEAGGKAAPGPAAKKAAKKAVAKKTKKTAAKKATVKKTVAKKATAKKPVADQGQAKKAKKVSPGSRKPATRQPIKPGQAGPDGGQKVAPKKKRPAPPTGKQPVPKGKSAPPASSGSFQAVTETGTNGSKRIRRDYDLEVMTREDQAYAFTPIDLSPNNISVSEVEILTVDCPGFLQFEGMAVTPGQRFTRDEMEEGLLTYLPAAMGTKKCFTYRVRRGPKWSTARCAMSVQVTRAYK